jgi:PAS domain S-box-containing protein
LPTVVSIGSLEETPALLWRSSRDFSQIAVNRAWREFTGVAEGSEAAAWLDCVHEENRNSIVALRDGAASTGEGFRAEYRMRRHDGAYRWVLDECRPVSDANGAVVGFSGVCTDIDALRNAADLGIAERESRLAEVHHRIRNNLQTMISLVRAHLRIAKEPQATALLSSLRTRVEAIGVVQQHLQEAREGSEGIDLLEFVQRVTRSLAVLHAPNVVEATVSGDRLSLQRQGASGTALIVSEIMTNLVGEGHGQGVRLRIGITRHAEGATILLSGKGRLLPSADPIAVQLLRAYARQAQATMRDDPEAGRVEIVLAGPLAPG